MSRLEVFDGHIHDLEKRALSSDRFSNDRLRLVSLFRKYRQAVNKALGDGRCEALRGMEGDIGDALEEEFNEQ